MRVKINYGAEHILGFEQQDCLDAYPGLKLIEIKGIHYLEGDEKTLGDVLITVNEKIDEPEWCQSHEEEYELEFKDLKLLRKRLNAIL